MQDDFFIPAVISGAVLALGILITILAIRSLRKKAKYEFENRTSGGVVGFKSYSDSVRHKSSKSLSGCFLAFGILVILGSLVVFRICLFILGH